MKKGHLMVAFLMSQRRRLGSNRNPAVFGTLAGDGDYEEDIPMRTLGLAIAAGALLVATHASAGTFPVNAGLIGAGSDLIGQVAVRVYVHEGNRYCFYFNGWHGSGWYRCG